MERKNSPLTSTYVLCMMPECLQTYSYKITHDFSPSAQEAEASGSLGVPGQPGIHSGTVSKNFFEQVLETCEMMMWTDMTGTLRSSPGYSKNNHKPTFFNQKGT